MSLPTQNRQNNLEKHKVGGFTFLISKLSTKLQQSKQGGADTRTDT